jgi:geranyl-CoA carboxylase alpha subunit
MVTGLDLVAWQIGVAAGDVLPLSQEDVTMNGHAIEVRLYAEDPANNFFPQTGKVLRWERSSGDGIRIDHGIEEGYEISPFYDPMLAKVIAHGKSREIARRKLSQALGNCRLFGVTTNQGFLQDVIERGAFVNGEATTAFIEEEFPDGVQTVHCQLQSEAYTALAAAIVHRGATLFGEASHHYGWTNGMPFESVYKFEIGEENRTVGLLFDGSSKEYRWRVEGGEAEESGSFSWRNTECGQGEWVVDGVRQVVHFHQDENELFVSTSCGVLNLVDVTYRPAVSKDGGGSGRVVATMDGAVIGVSVEKGQSVECGQTVVVLEAMKMEHSLKSDVVGIVEEVSVSPGDQVKGKQLLVVIKPKEAA